MTQEGNTSEIAPNQNSTTLDYLLFETSKKLCGGDYKGVFSSSGL
jgi:hypothetical protein